MKKLSSICLLAVMLVLLMPTIAHGAPEAVTVPPTGEIYLEGENYPDIVRYVGDTTTMITMPNTRLTADANAKNGSIWRAYANDTGVAATKGEINMPITVEASGTYYVSFAAHVQGPYYCTNPGLLLDGERFLTLGTTVNYPVTAVNAEFNLTEVPVYLTAGSHTITYQSLKASSNSNIYMWWDYVRISDASMNTKEISNTAETTLKADTLPYVYYEGESGTTAITPTIIQSGVNAWNAYGDASYTDGNGLFSNVGAVDIDGNNEYRHYWEVPIRVDTAGRYTVSVAAPKPVQHESQGVKADVITAAETINIYTDEVQKLQTDADKRVVGINAKTVYLPAGAHKIRVSTRRGSAANNILLLDYVKFTPVYTGSGFTAYPDVTGTVFPAQSAMVEYLAGTDVPVTYTYTGANAEKDSILRIIYEETEDNWTQYSAQTVNGGSATVTLPDQLKGKNIRLEFIPVDEKGIEGPIFTKEILNLSVALDISADLERNTPNTTAAVDIKVNSETLGVLYFNAILAFYDADGAMLDMTNQLLAVSKENPVGGTANFRYATPEGTANAKLFVRSATAEDAWDNDKAYIDEITD